MRRPCKLDFSSPARARTHTHTKTIHVCCWMIRASSIRFGLHVCQISSQSVGCWRLCIVEATISVCATSVHLASDLGRSWRSAMVLPNFSYANIQLLIRKKEKKLCFAVPASLAQLREVYASSLKTLPAKFNRNRRNQPPSKS
jgi:hypothetical protein